MDEERETETDGKCVRRSLSKLTNKRYANRVIEIEGGTSYA